MECGIRKNWWNGMEMEWNLIKLCGMEWKWNENKFRKFHENKWDENNYKFQHFLMNRTNCLFIIHNKKTFYYRTLSCEMWILEFWKFFVEILSGMECGMRKNSWNGMEMEWKFSRFWITTSKVINLIKSVQLISRHYIKEIQFSYLYIDDLKELAIEKIIWWQKD